MEFNEENTDDDDVDDDIDEPSSTMPARPTDALPGTFAKLEVLSQRVEMGELLWHPDDMTFEQYAETISGNPKPIFPA